MKLNYASDTNKYISDYIKFADTKAATLLTFLGLTLGGLFSLINYTLSKAAECHLANFKILIFFILGLPLAVALIFSLLTILSIFKTLQPNTNRRTDSLNSFPYISQFSSSSEYLDALANLAEADISVEYSKHNWELSHICMDKYSTLKMAITNFKYFLINIVIILIITSTISFLSYFS